MTILTLGESLARLSSFDGQRLSNSTQLDLTYGGAESNVAVNLSQLGHTVSHATKIPKNLLSDNLIATLHSQSVDTSHVIFGGERLGTYFLEGGAGLRPSRVIYDRAYSAISQMVENEWDFDELFHDVSLFHITGITLALSDTWHTLGVTLIEEANRREIPVSFDMNYRAQLWDIDTAKAVYENVLPHIDYLSATPRDAQTFMAINDPSLDSTAAYLKAMAEKFPNLKIIYGTKRVNQTPNRFLLTGMIYDTATDTYTESIQYQVDEVIDRVGAGDSYSAGILDGIILKKPLQETVDFATAASVLKHTIKGDINRFNREDIEQFLSNDANILR